jgi:hypothetical protein
VLYDVVASVLLTGPLKLIETDVIVSLDLICMKRTYDNGFVMSSLSNLDKVGEVAIGVDIDFAPDILAHSKIEYMYLDCVRVKLDVSVCTSMLKKK